MKRPAISRLPRFHQALLTIVALAGLTAVAAAAAPTFAWVRTTTATGPTTPTARDISTAGDGTSVVVGQFTGSGLDLGDGVPRTSGTGGTRMSFFVERLSATGDVLWARSSTGTGAGQVSGGLGVAAHPDGSSVVAGGIAGSSVDLGDGVARSGGIVSGFTERFNADGTVAWAQTTSGGPVGHKAASALPDGATIVTGGFSGANVNFGSGVVRTSAAGGTRNSILVEKFAADGTVLWVRASGSVGTSDSQGTSVGAFPDGTAVVAGTFQGVAVDLGDGVTRTSSNGGAGNTAFVEKVAGDGSIIWVYTTAAVGSSYITGHVVTAQTDGTAVLTGWFNGTGIDLGDGVLRTSANAGASNSQFTVRLRADGSVMWARTSGGTGTSEVLTAGAAGRPDGSVFVTGSFSGAAVDLGDGVLRNSGAGGSAGASFTQLFAADGTLAWVGTSTPSADITAGAWNSAVRTLPDGSALLVGGFQGTGVDLGDGVVRTSPIAGSSGAMFVAKLTDATATTPPDATAIPPAAAAPTVARLTARIRCTRNRCITTGALPAGVMHVSQTAARRSAAGASSHATPAGRTSGRCTTTARTYRCRITLAPGTWSVTTAATDSARAPIARTVSRVRVRTIRPLPVTG